MAKKKININGFSLTKAAIHTAGLTPIEKLVLVVISDYADSSAQAYPSIQTITGLVGLNARSGKHHQKIINIIKALEAKGLLTKGYHGHSRQYTLHLTKKYTTGCTLNNTPRGVHEYTTQHTSLPNHTEALKASSLAVQAPTAEPLAEPTESVPKVAQQSLRSFAAGASPLATSATPIKPPPSFGSSRSYRRPYSNQYIYEGADFRRSLSEDVVVVEEAL